MKRKELQKGAPHMATERAVTNPVHLFSISANMRAKQASSSKALTLPHPSCRKTQESSI